MRRHSNQNTKSFGEKIFSFILTVVFGGAFILSLWVFGPQLETYFESQVCRPDTIEKTSNGRGKPKTIICVDKKIGKKTDVSQYQYAFCCPPVIVIFLAAVMSIFRILIFRSSNKK